MDFLDPKRKKSHRRRLLIGYVLMAVAVAMGTLVLLFTAYGFDINHKTGDVIQNGTVFVDSTPSNSTIFLNGQEQRSKSSARLALPGSQQYSVKLTLDGYRDWTRTFALEGGKIERLTYPLLIPKTLKTKESQLYATAPGLTTQSPDRRWLLIQQPNQTYVFDVYDLNNSLATPSVLTIPASIMSDPSKPASLTVIDWSTDNRHVLVERTYENSHEFLMIDTTSVQSSVNINTTLTVAPSTVSLRDKKADQLYIFDEAAGSLRQGDLKNRTVSGAILSGVLAYKSLGADLVFYVTHASTDANKVQYRIRENDKATYLLRTSDSNTTEYKLDVAEYDGTPFYVVVSQQDDAAFVYRDPLPTLKGQSQSPLLVSTVIRLDKLHFISFSHLAHQYIAAQSGSKLVVYDIEGDRQFKISLPHDVAMTYKVAWMDAFRLSYAFGGKSYMLDFDGSNQQPLVPSLDSGAYFAPDYKTMHTLAPSLSATGRFALTETSLIKK